MSLAQVKKKQGSYFFCITFFIGFAAMEKKTVSQYFKFRSTDTPKYKHK